MKKNIRSLPLTKLLNLSADRQDIFYRGNVMIVFRKKIFISFCYCTNKKLYITLRFKVL